MITSVKDDRVAAVRRLRARSERDRSSLFFVEGARFVIQAADHGATIETLVVAPGMPLSAAAQVMWRRLRRSGVPCLETTPEVFRSLSLAAEPSGIGAVVRQAVCSLADVTPGRELCWLAVDTIRSPGNLGTILRTAAAGGAGGLIVLGREVDPFDPDVVRATMGALFLQRIVRTTPRELTRWKRRHGAIAVGASPNGQPGTAAFHGSCPIVLLLGAERRGLSSAMQALCDSTITIPMAEGVDSLNVAVATGILLYKLRDLRERRPYV